MICNVPCRVGITQSSRKGTSNRPVRSRVFEQTSKATLASGKSRESTFREQNTQSPSLRVWKYMVTGGTLLMPQQSAVRLECGRTQHPSWPGKWTRVPEPASHTPGFLPRDGTDLWSHILFCLEVPVIVLCLRDAEQPTWPLPTGTKSNCTNSGGNQPCLSTAQCPMGKLPKAVNVGSEDSNGQGSCQEQFL